MTERSIAPSASVEGIAIVGTSGRFPGASDTAALWQMARDGVNGITFFTDQELRRSGVSQETLSRPDYVKAAGLLDGAELFDAGLFGYSPREAELLDPQHRLFLEAAWHSLEDAACDPRSYPGRVGVFAGCGFGNYLLRHVHPDSQVMELAGEYQALLANDKDFLATRLSYKLDLTGPSLTLQTACSTSLVAICLACQSLEIGDCDTALAGGVSLRLPQMEGYVYQAEGILSPDGHCRSFDAKASGTVPGSGVGVVTLKRLEDALEEGDPIRAVIRGWAVNNDGGRKAGYTAPRGEGQEEVILEALAMAQVHPETIGYLEAHGTGTHLGDPIEVRALSQAYRTHTQRQGFCALGSLKTNIGHLDAAAGVAGLIKTVLALEHGTIPPNIDFEFPNPQLELESSPFFVPVEAQAWPETGQPRRAAVSSFGIGGTNAHMVLEQAPDPVENSRPETSPSPALQLLTWSAASQASLDLQTDALAEYLQGHPDTELADLAHTQRWGRQDLPFRRCLVAQDTARAREALTNSGHHKSHEGRILEGRALSNDPPIAILCPGQGSQYPGMAAGLHEGEEVFRKALDECLDLFPTAVATELRDLLLVPSREDPARAERLQRTELAQPGIFAYGYAAAALWRSRGIEAEALAGHSIGEWLAAHLAGVFRLEDAADLVAERGRLLADSPPGAMLAVALGASQLLPLLSPPLSLASANGPQAATASGPKEAIDELGRRLKEKGITHRPLRVSRAFHSSLVEEAAGRLAERVASVSLRPPRTPLLSGVSGTWMRAEEARDPQYWARSLRRPVQFEAMASELLKEPRRLLLDLGPGETLATLVRQQPSARQRVVVASGRHPKNPQEAAAVDLESAGRLWLAGAPYQPAGFSHRQRRRLRLPLYRFDRQRYWLEPADLRPLPEESVREADSDRWLYLPSWQRGDDLVSEEASFDSTSFQTPPDSSLEGESVLWICPGPSPPKELLEALINERPGILVHGLPDFQWNHTETRNLDPREPGHWQDLIAELRKAARLPSRIVLLVQGESAVPLESPEKATAFFALLFLAQALAHQAPSAEIGLTVITGGATAVLGGDLHRPDLGLLLGLARVLPQEHPNLSCRVLDLPYEMQKDRLPRTVDWLVGEIFGSHRDPLVALRGEYRWLPSWSRPAESFARPGRTIPEGRHFLFTGGLGRFSLAAAEQLAEHGNPSFSLLDRRSLVVGSREEQRLRQLKRSSSVSLHQVDVSDRSTLEAAVARAVAEHGPIYGLVHAAGASGPEAYATVAETSGELCRSHFIPKIHGLLLLDDLLGGAPPKLALVPTSLAPILGGLGLAAYAATDAWVDAFAEAATGQLPWRTVNWEGWEDISSEEGGSGAAGSAFGRQQNQWMLRPEELSTSFGKVAPGGQRRMVVATSNLEARLARWADPVASGATENHGRRDSSVPYEEPEGREEEAIVAVWQETLGIEPIGAEDDFFLLGGSSLVGLQIISRLRAELSVELPLRSFFEARTPRALARELTRLESQKSADDALLEEILAEVEGLNQNEVDQLLASESVAGEGTTRPSTSGAGRLP
ncbi:MAG: SDR family oxidoreductase [Deltaproteobacteria bacterium]|nr:SDR family oxidoreductase [Deltaproteobacteria bacterium]